MWYRWHGAVEPTKKMNAQSLLLRALTKNNWIVEKESVISDNGAKMVLWNLPVNWNVCMAQWIYLAHKKNDWQLRLIRRTIKRHIFLNEAITHLGIWSFVTLTHESGENELTLLLMYNSNSNSSEKVTYARLRKNSCIGGPTFNTGPLV